MTPPTDEYEYTPPCPVREPERVGTHRFGASAVGAPAVPPPIAEAPPERVDAERVDASRVTVPGPDGRYCFRLPAEAAPGVPHPAPPVRLRRRLTPWHLDALRLSLGLAPLDEWMALARLTGEEIRVLVRQALEILEEQVAPARAEAER
jgi:hypothetical protein